MTARDDALAIYHAAVAGALPGPATAVALGGWLGPELHDALRTAASIWIISVGKASHAMAASAVDALRRLGADVTGGLVVSTFEQPRLLPWIDDAIGDHPLPGEASRRAARRVSDAAALVRDTDFVLVLLSGGTSSLIGAPIGGVTDDDYRALCERLLGSGLDIAAMNAVRKRFSRWGAGRLAVALASAPVLCLALSDVPDDDLAAIGSGPCVPDALFASDVLRIVRDAGIALPPSCDDHLLRVERGEEEETPKAAHRAFARTTTRVLGGATSVLDAPSRRAARLGYESQWTIDAIVGDAAAAGRRLAAELLAAVPRLRPGAPGVCRLWRGETTVRLTTPAPPGGRCQELALAAAGVLRDAPIAVTLLAAGTDGRDGPTDAAGAIVDHATWDAIIAAGIDPLDALRQHASYAALDAVGALIRTGPTGTNVGDVIIGLAR